MFVCSHTRVPGSISSRLDSAAMYPARRIVTWPDREQIDNRNRSRQLWPRLRSWVICSVATHCFLNFNAHAYEDHCPSRQALGSATIPSGNGMA
jgi:hypothetical protein